MVCLAHVSDLHATPVHVERVSAFLNKRLLGWISWRLRRSRNHRVEVLEALADDLEALRADQVVVAGDLTNVAGPQEFPQARRWLERLGGPQRVSIVPGNHDAYVPIPRESSWDLWSAYLESDPGDAASGFPTLRVRGPLAILGLCSARPTPPFVASGSLGAAQLEGLEKRLTELSDSSLCRIVLIHHPLSEGAVSRRRSLTDAAALRGVLARTGADLVLHGHGHRTMFGETPGPRGPIPVVGVPSASDVGHRPHRRARYHLYEIAPAARAEGPAAGARFRIVTRIRGYDPARGRFSAEGEREL
jgi:3',5'-cyclic AMP phosphodiesterase CpdA